MIDLHADGYFNGGEAPFKYTLGTIADNDANGTAITVGDAAQLVTAAIDKDTNMLKLKLNAGFAWDDDDYVKGFVVTVMAEDANRESASSSVTIKPNRAPRLATGVVATTEPGLDDPNDAYVIGTMSGDIDTDAATEGKQARADGAAMCKTFNSCELTLFQDDDGDDFTVKVVSDHDGEFTPSYDKGKLTLTGMKRTKDPVEIDVMATDMHGLSSKKYRFELTVNAAPMLSEEAAALVRSIMIEFGAATSTSLFADATAAMAAFTDADEDTVAVTFKSANTGIVTVDGAGGTLTPKARGTTTVTATGTTGVQGTPDDDGLGQYAMIEFTVTVK